MPFDRSRYPADWEQVVAEVNRRAGNACEWCKVPNGFYGFRHRVHGWKTAEWFMAETENGDDPDSHDGDDCLPDWWPTRFTRVVLTTAHLDAEGDICQCEQEDRRKCSVPEHLRALCQSCHLNYDRPRHQRNAAQSRRRKALTIQPEFFDAPTPTANTGGTH